MTLREALDAEIDRAARGGTVHASEGAADAEIEVVEADRLGVRVRRVTVARALPHDPAQVGERWPRTLRDLPDRVIPIEVDPRLGGATLRSDPDDRADDTFVEVEVRGGSAEVRRYRVCPDGRTPIDWTMTREQLGRLIDALRDEPRG